MVCLMCLLPLFLVPIVNLLPRIFDYYMAKVYALLGWEYRRAERAPPACPFKPAARNDNTTKSAESGPGNSQAIPQTVEKVTEAKQD